MRSSLLYLRLELPAVVPAAQLSVFCCPHRQSKEGSINRQEALAACATWKHMINTQQADGGGSGCCVVS